MQSTFYLNLPGSLVPGDLSLHVKCIRDWDCQQGTTGGQAPVLVRAVLSKDYNIVEYEEYDLSSLTSRQFIEVLMWKICAMPNQISYS